MQRVKVALVAAAVCIAAASLVVSNLLIRDLTKGEERSMEVWAEAMRSLQQADENTDIGLVLKVIEGNHSIPVVVSDAGGNILAARNMGLPQDSVDNAIATGNVDNPIITKLKARADEMKDAGHCITFSLVRDETDWATGEMPQANVSVYYETSLMLRRLATYPYVQLGIVGLFIAVAIIALLSSKRAEQNKVGVGVSRETAHQLGTPISSLMAGSEILKDTYPDDPLLPEMDKDIRRLQLIAERFSKIGSAPALWEENLCDVIHRVVEYIGHRVSDKVSLTTNFPSDRVPVSINAPLFEWVIENLCKNAIDAMSGAGSITIYVYTQADRVAIEVSDTGKGIARSNFKNVFKPGFTTKQRGWGLGLSL
ncbi:MAG: HAMP domain-containing histidine kinase, partial [Alloprevotella sp.]|nr:HAMP domain-containing histidine kinase [Alloprevotella sp.]